MVSDCPPLVDTMSVFVQVERPAEQGHLEAPVRDVIIRIKVVPDRQAVDNEDSSNRCNDDDDDDDCPSLCSSEGSEATIRETSGFWRPLSGCATKSDELGFERQS